MPNDKFTLPPSPKIQTSPIDQVPEIKREVQGNETNLSRATNNSRATGGNSLPAKSSGNTFSSESTEGEIIHAIQQTSNTSDNGVLQTSRNSGEVQRVASNDASIPTKLNISTDVLPQPEATEEISAEEKELAEVAKQHKLTPKFTAWIKYFTDPKEKETYGNKTQSAMKAYSLDPVKDYAVAGSMGYQNFKKLQSVASIFAEQKGYTLEKMMDAAWLKFLQSNSPEWFDRLADWFGVRDLKPTTVIDARSQTNIINVSEGEQQSFNTQFRDFVKNQ